MAGGEKAKSSGEYGEQIVKKNIKRKILKNPKSMELIMSIHINLN